MRPVCNLGIHKGLSATCRPDFNRLPQYCPLAHAFNSLEAQLRNRNTRARHFLSAAMDAIVARVFPGVRPSPHTAHQAALLESHSFVFADMIAWIKPEPNLSVPRHMHIKGSGHYYPVHQWEPCLQRDGIGLD